MPRAGPPSQAFATQLHIIKHSTFFEHQQRPAAAQLTKSRVDVGHIVAAAYLGLDAQLAAQGADEVAAGKRGVSERILYRFSGS